MKRLPIFVLVLALATVSLLRAQPVAGPDVRLVLLIAVDQFRYDYLTKFRSEYTGGLHRLLTQGAVFTNANLEHYPTVTAVGHATMLTGATPSESGIIGNDWFDRETGASITSVSDPTVTPIGSTTGSAASPRRLLVSTVGDELKLASRAPKDGPDRPRVFGVSLKDRSAILPAGRGADGAYWWDTKTGRFVTSSYYVAKAPDWVQTFNDRKNADLYAGRPTDSATLRPVVLPDDKEYSYVARGGSWDYDAEQCRAAARHPSDLEWSVQDPQRPQSIWWHTDATFVGFRVVRPLVEQDDLVGLKSAVVKGKSTR